jgi:iron complex outermembrane receptor protein
MANSRSGEIRKETMRGVIMDCRSKGWFGWVTALVCVVVGPHAAQHANAEEGVIETMVVTATKRAQDAQDVPMSIEVIQSQMLDDFQIRDFKTLQNYVPNLLIQPSPGNDAIYIRGFGSQAANYAFDQSVSIYVDGIYGGRNRQFMAPFFDIERVEVMRGPQGALLGKNTAAGALSIITAGPTDTFEGSITSSYNFDREGVDIYGFVSGPLNDAWSGRLAARFTDLDGYIKNDASDGDDTTELDNKLIRGSLRFEPNDTVDITAKLEYADFETDGTNAVRVSPLDADLDDRKNAGPALYHPEEDKQESVNASLTANIALGEHTLTLITGYSSFEDDKWVGGGANNPESWLSTFNEEFDQFSQEVRLLSPTNQTFEYIVGAYFDTADYDQFNGSEYENFLGLPFFFGGIHHDFSQDAETFSAFAMGTWHATDQFRISASGRYTSNDKEGTFDQVVDYGIPISGPKSLSEDIDENNFDPSVTFEFDVNNDVMLYATYGEGSKAGGFVAQRAATQDTFTFKDESSENIEIGAKTAWLDRSVIFNIALFELKFEDLQVSTYEPAIPGFITGNAAKATSRGFESSLIWQVVPQFQLAASIGYLDAEYDDFPGAQCLAAATAAECDPVTGTQNLENTTIQGASKWTGNVRGTFDQPLSDNLKLSATLLAYFRSKFTTASDQDPVYGVQDGYTKWDARVEVGSADNTWGVALIGKNLGNKLTHNFAYLWPLSPPPIGIQFLDETRTVSLEGYLRF